MRLRLSVLLGDPKEVCVHINYGHSSSLSVTWHKLLENQDMLVDHTIEGSATQR